MRHYTGPLRECAVCCLAFALSLLVAVFLCDRRDLDTQDTGEGA